MDGRGSGGRAAAEGRILLVRHGESEGNRDRRFTQNEDVPLTARGREQAQAAAARLAAAFAPRRVVASPYTRARETAEIIAAALGCPLEVDPAFREQSFGVFAGQPYEALLASVGAHEGPRWEWRPPGGESIVDVAARAVPAFERLVREAAGEDVVLVSHGGVMFALWAYVTGSWETARLVGNAGIVVVEHRDGVCRAPRLLGPEAGAEPVSASR